MKPFQIVTICLLTAAAAFADGGVDTNELERLRVASVEARKAYLAARKAAGLPAFKGKSKRGTAATTTATTFTKSQKRFFENRRYCVARDTETIPGSVITTWYRNGKLDTKAPAVVTNVLKTVQGERQENPLEFEVVFQKLQAQYWLNVATNATARIERVTAALDERRAEYVQKRDAATLPTTKAIYQAFIDAIDRIKQRMDEEE